MAQLKSSNVLGNLTVTGTTSSSLFKGPLEGLATEASKVTHALSINGKSYNGSSTVNVGTLGVGYGGTGQTSFTSGHALIGNGTGAIVTRGIRNNTTKGGLGWTSTSNDTVLVTANTIAYWDGSYDGSNSNLSKLGAVTSGTWQGSVIGVAYGGTGGTSSDFTANRLVWMQNASKMTAGYHYADQTHIGVGYTARPSYTLYVGNAHNALGTFGVKTSITIADKTTLQYNSTYKALEFVF